MNKTLNTLLFIAALLMPLGLYAQGGRIARGIVKDDQGEPLIGAGVVVKEVPGKGTQTDLDGKFSLELPDKARTLVFSFIGMKSVEIPVKGGNISNLTVTLEYEADFLEQVVVTGEAVGGRAVGQTPPQRQIHLADTFLIHRQKPPAVGNRLY